jgi:hypothetical protein
MNAAVVTLAGILLSGALLNAQEQLLPIQFNVPYRCANGQAYVIERCEPGRRGEVCSYRLESPGQQPKAIVNVRSQLTGILNSCPAPAAKAPAAAPTPASNATMPAGVKPPQAPIGIPARATDPSYLREMPGPERVIREIVGTNAVDSLARQLAVMRQLERSVERMMDVKRYNKTPDEQQVIYTYSYAAYALAQNFAATHSAKEVKTFTDLGGRYEMDTALFREAIAKLYSTAMRAAHPS